MRKEAEKAHLNPTLEVVGNPYEKLAKPLLPSCFLPLPPTSVEEWGKAEILGHISGGGAAAIKEKKNVSQGQGQGCEVDDLRSAELVVNKTQLKLEVEQFSIQTMNPIY